MAVTNNLKKQVDLPLWEWLRFAPVATSALSALCTPDDGLGRYIYYLVAQTFYRYDTWTDGWIQLATPPITVTTFANLSYTKYGGYRGKVISCPSNNQLKISGLNFGLFLNQTIRIIAGTGQGQERTITICPEPDKIVEGFCTTAAAASIVDSTKKWKFNQWAGYQCRIDFGTGATQVRKILYNDATTLYFSDTNYQPIDSFNNTGYATAPVSTAATPSHYTIESTTVTVGVNWATHPDSTSRFVILTGGIWLFTSAATPTWFGLQYYDIAMDAWYAKTCPAGMVLAAFGTDGSIERTGEVGGSFDTGTTSAAGGTFTISDTSKAWTVDQWRNFQIRITDGTGIGQKRRIVCNTSNLIEVDCKWDTVPASGSAYSIYGDTDKIFLSGNAKSAIFQYDVESDLVLQASQYDDGIANNLAAQMVGWYPIAVTSMTSNPNGIWTVTAIPAVKGTGYKVGDILTISDGTNGKVIVETISGAGLVETVSLIAAGTNYTLATHGTTGGSGNGACTITVATRGTVGRIVTAINHYFKIGDTVTLSGAGGATTGWNGATAIIGVDSITGFDVINATATATIANTNSATLICDATKNWDVNEHTGKLVQCHLVGVAGVVVVRRITSNTNNTLTIPTITSALVNGTGRYVITDCSSFGRDEQYYADPTLSNEGHASSGGDTYFEDASKNWIGNQWNGYKVRIIAGIGRGKEYTITSSTNNRIYYASSGITPDATTHYVIMDTFGQCTTGAAATITDTFKNWNFTGTVSQWAGKSVRIIGGTGLGQEVLCTAGTATTISVATSPAAVTGDTFYQILSIPIRGLATRLVWAYGRTDLTKKGKYIYSVRGAASNQIDRYNINTEKFEFGLMVSPQFETFTTGSMYVYDGADKIYIHQPAGRIYCLDLNTRQMSQAGQIPYGIITAVIGNRMEIVETVDGLQYLYVMRHSGVEMFRILIFWN
jgi:hypothetical protein